MPWRLSTHRRHPAWRARSLWQRSGIALAAGSAVALATEMTLLPSVARADSGSTTDQATVQQILDGQELWINQRRARVHDRAVAPELLRTGASRAQLAFRTGAAGRLNRSSALRLGRRCYLLEQGQMLLSGPQSLCTRSARLSVRGTHVQVELDRLGGTLIAVLEGLVEVESGDGTNAATTTVSQGWRLRLGPDGRVLSRTRLSDDDYRAFVNGPLVDGFTTPLPQQTQLEQTLAAIPPGLSLACTARPEPELTAAVNAVRLQQGLPAFQTLPSQLAERNCRYLAPVLRRILSSDACDHDRGRWQALLAEQTEANPLAPVSELIACPTRQPIRANEVVRLWLSSPLHRALLLQRPRASALDCVTLTVAGRSAAMCTTWGRPGSSRS